MLCVESVYLVFVSLYAGERACVRARVWTYFNQQWYHHIPYPYQNPPNHKIQEKNNNMKNKQKNKHKQHHKHHQQQHASETTQTHT